MLLGPSRMMAALEEAAKKSPADQTLIAAERTSRTTLRFAAERIHQNFHEEEVTVWVKVARDGRMGVATTCSLSSDSLRRAIDSGLSIAQVSTKQVPPAFSTAPSKIKTPKLTTYFPETVHEPLSKSIEMIRQLWKRSGRLKMDLAGSFVVGEDELAVAGCQGLVQYQPFSMMGLRLVANQGTASPARPETASRGGSGFAAQASRNIRTIVPEELERRAWDFCRMNKNPKAIPLGKYDVLLEPEAVAELLEWLSYIGFGAKQVTEATSFMTGRMGERLMHPNISIVEDGSDPEGFPVPFDYEGVPKQKVTLIDRGVAKGIVYDSQYARLHRGHSTGHALSYDEFEGPLASNLFMAAGDTPHAELLKKMRRGLWISRFHYISGLLKTKAALMTGLTRDGTFLIENGKVAGAVKNLRFTQSILEAFSKVAGISRERQLVADPGQGFSAQVVPALLIKDFTFTGQTQ